VGWPGRLGWEDTLAGRGALGGLGLAGLEPGGLEPGGTYPADDTAEHWAPQPRQVTEHRPEPEWADRDQHGGLAPRQAGDRPVLGRHAAAPGPAGPPASGSDQTDEPPHPSGRPEGRGGGARGRNGPSSVRHPVRFAIYALVLAGLVSGVGAWASLDKSVMLSVDGERRAVHTYAGTVRGVLDSAGVAVGEHDILAPGGDAPVKDGAEIVLRRGRLLRLTVDGQTRPVWVTATSVDEALTQIGFRQSGLYLSASRSRRLPLDGFALEIRTPKTVTVIADGRTRRVVTTALSVGEMLEQSALRIGSTDRVSQLAAAPVVDGMRIRVTRVRYQKLVTRTVITFKTIEKEDPTLPQGTRKVSTDGTNGLQEVTYLVTYVDGRTASRRAVAVRVLTKPVDEVVLVGTKPGAGPGAEPAPAYGGLNWAGLAQCESGGNPRAVNPAGPYYGLYQFDIGTWQSNGGTGNPIDASPQEQTRVAYNLYQARGRSPWPVCGRYL